MSSVMIPCFVYHDPRAAIDWLIKAFGYEPWFVAEHEGQIVHAELRLGTSILIIDPAEAGFEPLQPEVNRASRIYTVVDDVDKHAARAVAAGARIVDEPTEQFYGGKTYSCADPEGYVWGFGTYDPWTARAES